MNSACRCDFSMHITEAAPRLKHSKLNAPLPANNSKTFAPTTRALSELKTACLTKSGVGRTSSPFGAFKIRRAALPPVMRMKIIQPQMDTDETQISEAKFYLCFICVHLWLEKVQLKISAKKVFIASHERLSAFSLYF